MNQINIVRVERFDGKLAVRLTGKRGYIFNSVQEAQAILDAFREAINEETLIVAAVKKVGLANVESLEGKTVTLTFDVVIS